MECNTTSLYSREALQAINSSNVFSSSEEKNTVTRMSAVAGLMYRGLEDLERVDALFPNTLVPLPTPEDLGIQLPTGLRVQAFRHHEEVIIAIRGTELTKDTPTLIKNLIADLGIGRHKSNEDLIESLEKTNERVNSSYNFKIDENTMQVAKNLINSRVIGHTDTDRALELTKRVGNSALTGGTKGSFWGGLAGATLAGCGVAAGLTVPPVGAVILLGSAAAGFLLGSGVGATKEMVTCTTIMDGYPTLLSYIKTIDDYIMRLKGSQGLRPYIKDSDTVITVGHSLAGYLAAVIGALHGDEIYSFNGPGLDLEEEMREIIYNLGLDRKVQRDVMYNSYPMENDFIGNLGKRDGSLRKLYLPITSSKAIGDLPPSNSEPIGHLPPSKYTSPLDHHGVNLITGILNNSSVLHPPKKHFPDPTDKDHPRFEEID